MMINFVRTSPTTPAHYGLARFRRAGCHVGFHGKEAKIDEARHYYRTTAFRRNARKSIVAENLVRTLAFHRFNEANAVHVAATYNAWLVYKCSDGTLFRH